MKLDRPYTIKYFDGPGSGQTAYKVYPNGAQDRATDEEIRMSELLDLLEGDRKGEATAAVTLVAREATQSRSEGGKGTAGQVGGRR